MRLLLIGEAWGAEEEKQNKPFVGPSGQLLRQALSDAGIGEFTITNCCSMRPPNNRKPTKSEIEKERPLVEAYLKNSDVVFLLGATAHESYSPDKYFKLSDSIGDMFMYEGKAYTSLYHPAYILRNKHLYNQYVMNLRSAYLYARGTGL